MVNDQMNIDYKYNESSKESRQDEFTNRQDGNKQFLSEDMQSLEETLYKTCENIRHFFDEEDANNVVNLIFELSNLIKNETLSYIPGLLEFDIPNILFDSLLIDSIKDASIICLNRILLFNESEFLFESESFCKNFLSAFFNEKISNSLEYMLKLLDNIFSFNNQITNSFFIENNLLQKLISIIGRSSNQNTICISFNLISQICKAKLEIDDVVLIYRIILKYHVDFKIFNLYFMKIFYNLIIYDSFLYEDFIQYKFYSLVKASLIQNNLNNEIRYGVTIVRNLIEKYDCYQYFDPINFMSKLLIEPKKKDDVLCLISIINTINLFIGKNQEFTSFMITEDSLINLLNLAQDRNASIKVNLLKIFISIYNTMEPDNFNITATTENGQNIFHLLADLIDTGDIEYTKPALELICTLFEKSNSLNLIEPCIECFQSAFTPDISNCLDEFHDELINELNLKLQSFLPNDEEA